MTNKIAKDWSFRREKDLEILITSIGWITKLLLSKQSSVICKRQQNYTMSGCIDTAHYSYRETKSICKHVKCEIIRCMSTLRDLASSDPIISLRHIVFREGIIHKYKSRRCASSAQKCDKINKLIYSALVDIYDRRVRPPHISVVRHTR